MVGRFGLFATAAAAVGVLLVVAGCSDAGVKPAAQPDRVFVDTPSPSTTSATPSPTPMYTGPHFDTPQAAMRYLAAAWNRHDIVALKRVTTPDGRAALFNMYRKAVNLPLDRCTAQSGQGDYDRRFSHDYPASMHKHHVD